MGTKLILEFNIPASACGALTLNWAGGDQSTLGRSNCVGFEHYYCGCMVVVVESGILSRREGASATLDSIKQSCHITYDSLILSTFFNMNFLLRKRSNAPCCRPTLHARHNGAMAGGLAEVRSMDRLIDRLIV